MFQKISDKNTKVEDPTVDYSKVFSTAEKEYEWIDLVIRDEIPQGLKLHSDHFDEHFRLKAKTMVGIFGLDGSGKSTFYFFMATCYARYHNLKFLLICRENNPESIRQKIMEFYIGYSIHLANGDLIAEAKEFAYKHFDIIDNNVQVNKDNLFDILEKQNLKDYFAVFLDPYNAVQYDQSPKSNYEFLDKIRSFQNKHDISFHISMHISSDKARNYTYGDKETIETFDGQIISLAGEPKTPRKNFVEGGQPIANKLDDIIIVHRVMKIFELRRYTMIAIDKVKETATGGMPTFELPILFKMEKWGNTFIDKEGNNPLTSDGKKKVPKQPEKEGEVLPIVNPNQAFDFEAEQQTDLPF